MSFLNDGKCFTFFALGGMIKKTNEEAQYAAYKKTHNFIMVF